MMSRWRRYVLSLLAACALLLAAQPVLADRPPKPKEGFGVYIIAFRSTQGDRDGKEEKLDVGKFGGMEHERRRDVWVVTLPLQARASIEARADVAYVQRVWMGEPLDDWKEGPRPPSRLTPSTEAEVVPASWDSQTYLYDGSGNIKSIGSDQYGYDSAGRIIQATVQGTTETYGYDSFGNLKAKATGGRATAIPAVDSNSNRYANERYDVAGNITRLPGPGASSQERAGTYEYDGLGMVTALVGHTPAYDAQRMIYTADDERLAIAGPGSGHDDKIMIRGFDGKVLREYRGSIRDIGWMWVEDYVYGDGRLLAAERELVKGGRLYFHLDHLGSVRLITKADKTKLSEHRYFPFGVEQSNSTYEVTNFDYQDAPPPRIEPMKFTGHERDFYGNLNIDGTDHLDYMHARFYEANLGRFLSVDPAGFDPKRPQTWNRYTYVLNNPINMTDPTGRCGEAASFVGPRVPCEVTLKPPRNGSNWTAEQRAAENAKNAQRAELAEQGKLVVTRGQARPSSAQVASANGGPAPAGAHLDHTQEVVLGGAPLAKENIAPLDATVNTSNGARVKNAIAGLADGTVITKFNYTVLNAGGVLTMITQGLSYNTFMQNQEKAHPGYVNQGDMMRWVFTGDTRATLPPCTPGNPC